LTDRRNVSAQFTNPADDNTHKGRECAFCPNTAKLSREHVISNWINGLFPGGWKGKFTDRYGQASDWESQRLDWTAKVVCESCNNTWMSDIEEFHAKPTMTPLIQGKINMPIRRSQAHSLALFAFKTAVILDHTLRHKDPFFSRRLRYAFRLHQEIPTTVQMWMCLYFTKPRRVDVHAGRYKGELSPGYPVHVYVCTCGIGRFAFQVVAAKQMGTRKFSAPPTFDNLAAPLWPHPPVGFIWPIPRALRSAQELTEFHRRWTEVMPLS
jgi:hypothetical protein